MWVVADRSAIMPARPSRTAASAGAVGQDCYLPGAGSVQEKDPPGERTLRHLRSILYSLVLAPAAWVLTAVGLTGDLTARGRDGFAVENFTGLLLLLLAGAAYGILVLGPFSPAGPLLAGVVYLAISAWALTSPSAYADVWSPSVAKDGFDLSRPGYGLAAILAVPLICTALSARRWEKYEPPVLPLIGQIGRARGAAPAQGMPLSNAPTTAISAGLAILDPEPTTVLRLAPADSTTAVVPALDGSHLDEDPTIAWTTPKALAAVAATDDEDTVATPPSPDEPTTVVDVSAGEPTVAVVDKGPTQPAADEGPTQPVAEEGPTQPVADEDPTQPVADEDPTQPVADEDPTELVTDDEPADDDVPTEAVAAADEPDEAVVEEPADADTEEEPAEALADEEPEDAVVDEPTEANAEEEPEAVVTEPETDEAELGENKDEDEDEETVPVAAAGADLTEVIRLPVADNGEKTQVVRLPVADNGDRTQVVRLPVAEVVPFPAVDPDEKTQVIRLPQVLQFPVRSPETEPGHRTRDLSNRATGDPGGDETQVIRLAGKTVDDEKTQVIRPALVTRPADRSEVLPFRPPTLRDATPPPPAPTSNGDEPATKANIKAPLSIADAEAPNFADDPTSPISMPSRNGDEATEPQNRSMTVMKMERPPDDAAEETTHLEIPTQRRPGTDE